MKTKDKKTTFAADGKDNAVSKAKYAASETENAFFKAEKAAKSPIGAIADEELCRRAASGEEEAMEALFKRYEGLVRAVARSYFLRGGDFEDLTQEGMMGLFKAVMSFNGDSPFVAFARLCIERNIVNAVRKDTTDKNRPLNDAFALDAGAGFDEAAFGDATQDPEYLYAERERKKENDEKLKAMLSPLEYEIVSLYLGGYSQKEIALLVGKHPKTVDNAVQRARKKLTAAARKGV